MRITVDLDDDVIAAASELGTSQRRSLGSVISELARQGLAPARVDAHGDMPTIHVPQGTPAITPEMVCRGLEEH
jgi:hypothetical protein